MKVSIVGTGYVGLVTGACFAEVGHDVVCVDVDRAKVDKINRGEAPIHEAGLAALLQRHVNRRLRATTDFGRAVQGSDATFIAVGTPFDGERIDLRYVRQAARDIGIALRDKREYHVVAVKSTVVPGTTDDVVRPILEEASDRSAGKDFGVAMNPEFLTEGVAISDCMEPDRIVIGGIDDRTVDVLSRLYATFRDVPVIRTNNKTAEMIKYTSNAVLATLISFSNEIGNLCARVGGVDMADVMHGVHSARYFTSPQEDGTSVVAPITSFLYAGCGFGGSCLPKDVMALVAFGEAAGQPMPLLDTVIKINLKQPQKIIEILERNFSSLDGRKVCILGLAFKPDTSDVRESPAIPIARELIARGAVVSAFDPVAIDSAKAVLQTGHIRFVDNLEAALRDVDAAVLVTSWDVFRQLPEMTRRMNPAPLIVDGRRMLDKHQFARYAGIGM